MSPVFDPATLKQILKALEVKLDENHQVALREHLDTTLAERVGLALVDLLDDNEVRELIAITEKGDHTAINTWLDVHVPDYKEVVEDEIAILLGDLSENSENL